MGCVSQVREKLLDLLPSEVRIHNSVGRKSLRHRLQSHARLSPTNVVLANGVLQGREQACKVSLVRLIDL